MKRSLLLIFLLGLGLPAARGNERLEWMCAHGHWHAAPADSPEHRKYAPSREVDVLHLRLEVTPDFQTRTVAGKATLRFTPIARPVDRIRLDAVDLRVHRVSSLPNLKTHVVADDRIEVFFEKPLLPGETGEVTVEYDAEPTRGLYFRTPEMGYPAVDTHLFTQGETHEARHWYPAYDFPNEKFSSEIICHAPADMVVLSNGRLVSRRVSGATQTVHWLQEKPHVNYLVSLLVGYFKKVEDQYRGISLGFYTPASQIELADRSFRDTKDMMGFFEKEIGVPYPWDKYDQVCVADFHFGGMENTSITTLTDRTLFPRETENLRSSQGLVAHELAHQWFGDLVTCKDWSHIWLNEGFATYYTHLYEGHKHGREAMLYGLWQDARGFLDTPNDIQPIVYRKYDSPEQNFGFHAYPKGSWVLHMLRSQLGEELFRKVVKTYLERHQYGTVVTEDLNAVVEELSGRSFDPFFDQWVYHAHHPELGVSYSWDEAGKMAKLSIQQNQKLSETVLLFQFPLTVRFKAGGQVWDREIQVRQKSEDFYFSLPKMPEQVRLDPEYTLLAKVAFHVPGPLLRNQVRDASDMMGRLLAVEQYGQQKTREAVEALQERLQKDPFHGVRIEASRALRSIHTPEALKALMASLQQPDARVRKQVVSDVGGFYREEARDALIRVTASEKNPEILAQAISSLGVYHQPEIRSLLEQHLKTASWRNLVADAAIQGMRAQRDPAFIPRILELLASREGDFTSQGFGRGLEALAFLAHDPKDKGPVFDFLARQANHPKQGIRLAALSALGTLEDPRALPVLERYASANRRSRERDTAERAVAAIHNSRRTDSHVQELRRELLELQKENRQIRQEFETLKKKLEARPAAEPARETPPAAASPTRAKPTERRKPVGKGI